MDNQVICNQEVGHDLATERERQLTTAYANQPTGLTNRRAANWAPEVAFSPFRALSRRQLESRSVAKSAQWGRRNKTLDSNKRLSD